MRHAGQVQEVLRHRAQGTVTGQQNALPAVASGAFGSGSAPAGQPQGTQPAPEVAAEPAPRHRPDNIGLSRARQVMARLRPAGRGAAGQARPAVASQGLTWRELDKPGGRLSDRPVMQPAKLRGPHRVGSQPKSIPGLCVNFSDPTAPSDRRQRRRTGPRTRSPRSPASVPPWSTAGRHRRPGRRLTGRWRPSRGGCRRRRSQG